MKVKNLIGVLRGSCSVCYKHDGNFMCQFCDTPWQMLDKTVTEMYIGEDNWGYGVIYIETKD